MTMRCVSNFGSGDVEAALTNIADTMGTLHASRCLKQKRMQRHITHEILWFQNLVRMAAAATSAAIRAYKGGIGTDTLCVPTECYGPVVLGMAKRVHEFDVYIVSLYPHPTSPSKSKSEGFIDIKIGETDHSANVWSLRYSQRMQPESRMRVLTRRQ